MSTLFAFLYRAFATDVLLALDYKLSLTSSISAFFSMALEIEFKSFKSAQLYNFFVSSE